MVQANSTRGEPTTRLTRAKILMPNRPISLSILVQVSVDSLAAERGVPLDSADARRRLHRARHGRRPNGERDQRCRGAESRAGNAVISSPGAVLALDVC